MTVTYLDQPVASGVFDANGNGTATFQVPTGSFLVPRFVRVTTNIQSTPAAHCTVYMGAVTVTSLGTYIDDTVQGNSDTSSAIAGNIGKSGDAITAVWTGGNPGDTGILNVVGLYSDNFPEAVQYLTTAGNRFVGHGQTEILSTAAKVLSTSPQSLPPGNVTIGPFDVRGFSSWYLKVNMKTAGAATAFNVAEINIAWLSGPIGSLIDIVYQDDVKFWADSPSGSFAVSNGSVELQDIHHGPYMLITFNNNAATDTLQLSYTLTFTSRTITSPFYRQAFATNGVLVSQDGNTGAGNLVTIPLPLSYGEAWAYCLAGANTITATISFGPGTGTFRNIFPGASGAVASGASNQQRLVLPKTACQIQLTGGAPSTGYNFSLLTEYSKE